MKFTAALLIATTAIATTPNEYEEAFVAWAKQFNKNYDVSEFFQRFANFKLSHNFIASHNSGLHSYTVAHNEFSDMTNTEFLHHSHAGYTPRNRDLNIDYNLVGKTDAPESVDWTTKGAVTPVKNQGQCGSCWSFSTTGSLEGANFLKNGKLVSLSEQQLVDCSTAEGNQGCKGGIMDDAFEYVQKSGLCTEAAYPYTGKDDTCSASSCSSVISITGHKDVPSKDLDALAAAVAQQPVSIAVDASGYGWQLYRGGVYSGGLFGSCGTKLDHGVLLVGYGNDSSKGDYWKVKNSWGASWGENGYIRLKKTSGTGTGTCGLAIEPSYPTL